MNNIFPLDTIRAIIEQTLLEQKLIAPTKYFGGKNEVNLFSFYEQLQKDSEVDRYVEIYNDLVEQQNRSGLIMNGTIIAPENPTITNLYLDTIIPMSFTCSFRVKLGDRDKAITTINNLIEKLKGRKQDVALFENGTIHKTQTICNNDYNGIKVSNGDYIGSKEHSQDINIFVNNKLNEYSALGINVSGLTTYPMWFYYEDLYDNTLKVAGATSQMTFKTLTSDDQSDFPCVFIPPLGLPFDKYKVSMSFDSIRCDEPRILNANEYCTISFGGSATLVNNGVALGNDLVKLGITKSKIVASPTIVITETANLLSSATWLEPLEMPSGNSANSLTNILNSNKFNTNSHTTNITIANQYSFVVDRSIPLIDQFYKYARYGYFGIDTSGETADYTNAITPNMVYKVYEVNSSWGVVEINDIDAKIVESIDIENTESDTLSMTLTFQKQGGSENGGSGGQGGGGDTGEYVTIDTTQTITGAKTFTNQLTLTNTITNGTYVYTLPLESGRLATREWVQDQNYVTQTWVENKGYSTTDTTNSAGAVDKKNTKLYLIGSQLQGSALLPNVGLTTYSNEYCYIGSDNCLYSNGQKVSTENSWREIDINDTSIGTNTLNLKSGTNISFAVSGGVVVISSSYEDTNYYLTSGSWSGLTYTFTSNGGNPSVSFTLPLGINNLTTTGLQYLIGYDSNGNLAKSTLGTSSGGWNYMDIVASGHNIYDNFNNIIRGWWRNTSNNNKYDLHFKTNSWSTTHNVFAPLSGEPQVITFTETISVGFGLNGSDFQVEVVNGSLTSFSYSASTLTINCSATQPSSGTKTVAINAYYGGAYRMNDSGNEERIAYTDTIRIYY